MRRTGLLLCLPLLLARVHAEDELQHEFTDTATGLFVRKLPEGWRRTEQMENDTVRFASTFEGGAEKQYILFTVEGGPSGDFDEDAWMKGEQAAIGAFLKETTTPFKKDSLMVGGELAPSYTVAGKTVSKKGTAFTLWIRACGIVRDDQFFKLAAVSYNNTHEQAKKALDAMWEAVGFDDTLIDDEAAAAAGIKPDSAPVEGAPTELEDAKGNYKLTFPGGWEIVADPPDKPRAFLRLQAQRTDRSENLLINLYVTRELETRAEIFSVESATDRLDALRNGGFFEQFYGKDSKTAVMPEIDESVTLGDAEKSGAYTMRSLTMEESANVDEAKKLINRGDKDVTVPKYKELVLRGRIAMLSPNVYHIVAVFHRELSDDEQLGAELKGVLDSFQFLVDEALPPPLVVNRQALGDTKSDPKNNKDRKSRHVYSERATRTHNLELKFTVPAGFARIEKGVGGNMSLYLVAQDDQNNWVRITMAHLSMTRWGEANPNKIMGTTLRDVVDGWRSNWTSKARGVKRMNKPRKFSLGPSLKGKGYQAIEGSVEGFRGTFTCLAQEKSTWRTEITIETRGQGDKVFAAGIKKFVKGLRLKKLK